MFRGGKARQWGDVLMRVKNKPPVQRSEETDRRLAILFPPGDRERARALLRDGCGNHLFTQDMDEIDLQRWRSAALKLSEAVSTNYARPWNWRIITGGRLSNPGWPTHTAGAVQ